MNKKQNPLTIRTYLSALESQINEDPSLKYVLLRLSKENPNEVDELNDLLQQKNTINYIFMNYHQEKSMTDDNEDKWSLCITGFKSGAKKDSPRKLGLLAYRSGYIINFKTRVFYDSDTINKYDYTADGKKGVIQYIKASVDNYLENTTNYNSNVNYIKPERKIKSKK
jgi:hypothetical protein